MTSKIVKWKQAPEWPTLIALVLCYGVWSGLILIEVPPWVSVPILALCIAFQSSLQHEIIHGHPFQNRAINELLVFPSLNLFIPFIRFRDTHLAHHKNQILTDPYDDPESNYLSPNGWRILCPLRRAIMSANATLFGRILIGPAVGQVYFMWSDAKAMVKCDRAVVLAWLVHIPAAALVIALVWVAGYSILHYIIAAYIGLSLLKIRTFAEHQAHELSGARTAVVEDRGFFALLFLNNNLHIVHHMHPQVPWYV